MPRRSSLADWWRAEAHGLSIADLDDVFAAKPEWLVVGTGQPGRMQVEDSCRETLAAAGVLRIPAAEPADSSIP